MKKRRSHFIRTYHFSIFPFPSHKTLITLWTYNYRKRDRLTFFKCIHCCSHFRLLDTVKSNIGKVHFNLQSFFKKQMVWLHIISGWFSCLAHKIYLITSTVTYWTADKNIHKGMQKCHLFAQACLSYSFHTFNTAIKCLPFILHLKYFLLKFEYPQCKA